jgi:hypothetical protein
MDSQMPLLRHLTIFLPQCVPRFMWGSFMFAIWVFKVPQHVSKNNNKKQFNGSFKPKDNTIDKQTNNY